MNSKSCTWWGLEEVRNPLNFLRHNSVRCLDLTLTIFPGSISPEVPNRLIKYGIKLVNAIANTE